MEVSRWLHSGHALDVVHALVSPRPQSASRPGDCGVNCRTYLGVLREVFFLGPISSRVCHESFSFLARGLELFAEYGVYRTMGRCGALVVFSRAERRVLVLGDEALDTAMGDQGWENLAGTTAEHIEANGAIDEAALYVFDELEALLGEVFPMEYGQGQIRELAEPVVEGHTHD